jgi:anti-sigma regulatory factor (Ser/Thr protein kinase)
MTSQGAKPDHSCDTSPSRELLRRLLPAQPGSLRPARAAIAEWLTQLHWPGDDAEDLILAVNEAVTNAIEHAYPADRPGSLGLCAWCGEELRTPPPLMDERMGHEDGSVQARYSHVTAEMRRRLMLGLTEEWESALNARREMCPRSPVAALDALLRASP